MIMDKAKQKRKKKEANLKKTVWDLIDTLKKLMRAFPAEDGKVQQTNYFILFSNSEKF